jgi:pimeloyl-ACP methyl ester carboxylesterase
MTRGSFKTTDGCAINYVDEGDGVPVLWQHGLGATQAQAAEVFPQASGFRRITMECRGHADSELGALEALSIEQFTDDATSLLDHLGVSRAVVGGISLGAAIALRLAVYSQRVSALIIARPAWIDERVPERMQIYLDVAELLAQHGSVQGLERLHASERYRLVMSESPDNAASMRIFFQRDNPASTVALLSRIPARGLGVTGEQMSRLSLPTLVIANEGDYVHSVAMATEVAERIRGAKLKIIPAKNAIGGAYVKTFKSALDEFLIQACGGDTGTRPLRR